MNPVLDMQSAPVTVAGLPGNQATDPSAKHQKDMIFGAVGENQVSVGAADVLDGEEEPTEEEYATLRKIPAPMKWTAIAMCLVELSERASYYGVKQLFSNFVRGPLPKGGNGTGAVAKGEAGVDQSSGALGMGSVPASAVTNLFTFLAYVIPILGAIVSDTKWGRFKTICVGTFIGFVAHVLLVIPAIPKVIAGGHAFIPFIISVIILAFASGFIKPCLGPLLCDQSPVKKPVIRINKKGERVVLDPQTTVARYLLIFYWCINVGAFMAVATSYTERYVGFWLAYLEPGIVYMLMPIVLLLCYKRLYHAPAQGSVLVEFWKVMLILFKRGGLKRKGGDQFWNLAKPSYIEASEGTIDRSLIFWDDTFVEEIRQSLSACAVFLLIPIFILGDGGIGNQENDQSASMTLNSIPNDVINNFNPLVIIIATPILTFLVYPFFDRIGHPLKPMTRMCIGFLLCSSNMVIAAIVQWKVYQTSPCGYYATDCELGVSPVNIAWQIPYYAIPALGEIFVNVTSYELAYTRAPARMKGLVYAICLFSSAISSAIGLALSAVIVDPYLIWPYVALAVANFVVAFIFPTYFKHLDIPMQSFADPDRQAGKYQPGFTDMPKGTFDNSHNMGSAGNIEDVERDTKEKY